MGARKDAIYEVDEVGGAGGATHVIVDSGAVSITGTVNIRALAFATDKVDVSGSIVGISGSVAVTGGFLTDAQLRATPVPVSGPLTDAQLRATPVPVSGAISFSAPQHVIIDSGTAAVTIADGADVSEGVTTGPAVFGDVTGTVNARLRGISTILNNIWDQTNTWIRTLSRSFWNTTTVSATTTWTSATALNTSVDYLVTGQGVLLFRFSPDNGTFGAAKMTFYASKDNGANYEPIPILIKGDRDPSLLTNGIDLPAMYNTISLVPFSPAVPFTGYVDVISYTHIRVKLTTVITGILNFSFKTITSANPAGIGPQKGMMLYGPPSVSQAGTYVFSPVSTSGQNPNALSVAGTLTHNTLVPQQLSQLGVLPAAASPAAPSYGDGAQVLLSTNLAGSLRSSIVDASVFNDPTLALNAEVALDLDGFATARFRIATTVNTNASLVFEGTLDLVNYFQLPAFAFSQNLAGVLINQQFVSTVVIATTLTGIYLVNVEGLRRVRVRCSAFVSGDIAVDIRASIAQPILYTRHIPSVLHVTAVGAANAAVTATLPAAGPGLFHYITQITLQRASTAVLAGTAVLTHTSTNLPGNPNWTVGNAMVAGDSKTDLSFAPANPLKSSVANTATTIVMPAAGLAVLNRINVSYFVGF